MKNLGKTYIENMFTKASLYSMDRRIGAIAIALKAMNRDNKFPSSKLISTIKDDSKLVTRLKLESGESVVDINPRTNEAGESKITFNTTRIQGIISPIEPFGFCPIFINITEKLLDGSNVDGYLFHKYPSIHEKISFKFLVSILTPKLQEEVKIVTIFELLYSKILPNTNKEKWLNSCVEIYENLVKEYNISNKPEVVLMVDEFSEESDLSKAMKEEKKQGNKFKKNGKTYKENTNM